MTKEIISPCISICKNDNATGYCFGCARKISEKKIWKDENTTNEWKTKNLEILVKRMNTKQLETFKESYNFKIKSGISLIKKKLQEIK